MPENPLEITLEEPSYGKDGIRLIVSGPAPPASGTKTGQPGAGSSDGADVVRDITFSVRVQGRFDASYRVGDNVAILPSDTLRRHVLQVGAANREASLEEIVSVAAAQIHSANPAFTTVVVNAREEPWTRVGRGGFTGSAPTSVAACRWGASGCEDLLGGVEAMNVLATGGSAFGGFYRDALTVQGEAEDRPLCAALTARWTFASGHVPTREAAASIPVGLAEVLADRPSNAIQQLVTAAGFELLARTPALVSVWMEIAALALAPLDAQLDPGQDRVRAHEATPGPLGVTAVRVSRA